MPPRHPLRSRRWRAATDAAGLPPAARPVRVELMDELPRLASGKPDRRALEARMRGGPDE
jgi:O-succinylbenzoic acid--CoA ligase